MKRTDILMFVLGVVFGGGAAYFALENSIAKKVDERVQKEVEAEKRHLDAEKAKVNDLKKTEMRPIVEEKKDEAKENKTTDYNAASTPKKEGKKVKKKTEIIPPDRMGDCGFEQITLTYYAGDSVLADNMDDVVDLETIGGIGNLQFGLHEPEIVNVRNNILGLDYEIIRDEGSFEEYVSGQQF